MDVVDDFVPQPDHAAERGRQKVYGRPTAVGRRFRLRGVTVVGGGSGGGSGDGSGAGAGLRVTRTGHALLGDGLLARISQPRLRPQVHFVRPDVPVTACARRHFHRVSLRAAVLVPVRRKTVKRRSVRPPAALYLI